MLRQSFRESCFFKLYSTNFEQVIVSRSMKESFCYYATFEKVIRPTATRICLCKFNTLTLEKKVLWRYYVVDFELINGYIVVIEVGIKL